MHDLYQCLKTTQTVIAIYSSPLKDSLPYHFLNLLAVGYDLEFLLRNDRWTDPRVVRRRLQEIH
jgi:hypothetical protein